MLLWLAGSLPQAPRSPLISGYGLAPAENTARTDMESGTPRVRLRSTARNDRVSVTWRLTDTEMAEFREWYDSILQYGTAWFSYDLAIATGGIVTTEARFVGPWKSQPSPGLNWLVTATLEIR